MGWFANLFPKHTWLGKALGSTNKSRGIHLDNLLTPGGWKEEIKHLPENIKGFVEAEKAKGSKKSTKELVEMAKAKGKPLPDGKLENNTTGKDDDKTMTYIIYAVVGFILLKVLKVIK